MSAPCRYTHSHSPRISTNPISYFAVRYGGITNLTYKKRNNYTPAVSIIRTNNHILSKPSSPTCIAFLKCIACTTHATALPVAFQIEQRTLYVFVCAWEKYIFQNGWHYFLANFFVGFWAKYYKCAAIKLCVHLARAINVYAFVKNDASTGNVYKVLTHCKTHHNIFALITFISKRWAYLHLNILRRSFSFTGLYILSVLRMEINWK